MTRTTMKKAEEKARQELLEMGAVNEKTEDRYGDTKSGWWIDGVFLAKNPVDALKDARGQ